MFQRRTDPGAPEEALATLARHLLPLDHGLPAGEQAAIAGSAVSLYRGWAARPDVTTLLAAGECHYEVPFFYDPPDRPGERVRGVIDCMVVHADGGVTVVEFKTGQPRPEHRVQADWYSRAVEAALETGPVDTRILYP
jgi:ATP-dependent exoDNAse (exonuclease V) beta subunit